MIWNKPKFLAFSYWLLAVGFLQKEYRKAISFPLLAISLFAISGCSVYSFTGTNIDPSVQTMSIATFANNSNNGPSALSQQFTEDFKDYFQRNTPLKMQQRDGDLQIEGQIIAYDFAPAAIQREGNVDQAGVNRLTIQVRVKFTNTKDDTQSFEQTFQSNGDFPASQSIVTINSDPSSIRRITTNIITDVFNKSVANW